jgi:hypothetical protein
MACNLRIRVTISESPSKIKLDKPKEIVNRAAKRAVRALS